MVKFLITVDKDICIGCGACVKICSNFELVDGKSKPIKSEVNDVGCNEEAQEVCPVDAISIDEK